MITIYKKDTKGKTRYISAWTKGDILYQESGIVGGKGIPHQKVCTPKNVGRSNETTGEQQANLERDSLIVEKLKGEYFRTQTEAETQEVILPMLAKSYKDEVKKIVWKSACVQPKLDGMRALYKDGVFTSREGTIIDTVPHLIEVLKSLDMSSIPDVRLDGELYAHGLTFQENMRLIKKHRPGESEFIKFHVYDMVADNPFAGRYAMLQKVMAGIEGIELVPTYVIGTEEGLKSHHKRFLSEGYEGSILRWGDEPYKPNGRSSNLLKYKDFLDMACVIKDIEPAKDRPTWAVPVFEKDGKEFRAGMKYSHAEREEFLKNKEKYIGKVAELRFFEYSEDGIPRFPVMVGIRLDKKKQD